ncbi:hypothetical protein DID88_001456 [Monilinia fructigena]|uniref:DUF1445 domain-containing protein n=1 Tax=Monilinia fructigena TaxID=38457 RepID=A0A395IX56_9HELO|nr:hypothetical protein DID88_001456 [Monilinia fructigena]
MASSIDSSSPAIDPTRRRALIPESLLMEGVNVRISARKGEMKGPTSALAPSYFQANLIVLPSGYADDFTRFCQRNPVPCPLIAKSATVGSYNALVSWIEGVTGEELATDIDIRTDAPKYMAYKDGELVVFEDALKTGGLMPRHAQQRRNVPMYKTNISLCPAGVFDRGTYVVSMRPYRKDQIERVREITRPYLATHGEPIAWGWEAVAQLGIKDINKPDWGDRSVNDEGYNLESVRGHGDELVPVFWGCGVTPQYAVVSAGLKGVVMGHAPGHMLVLDCRDDDLLRNRFERGFLPLKMAH